MAGGGRLFSEEQAAAAWGPPFAGVHILRPSFLSCPDLSLLQEDPQEEIDGCE